MWFLSQLIIVWSLEHDSSFSPGNSCKDCWLLVSADRRILESFMKIWLEQTMASQVIKILRDAVVWLEESGIPVMFLHFAISIWPNGPTYLINQGANSRKCHHNEHYSRSCDSEEILWHLQSPNHKNQHNECLRVHKRQKSLFCQCQDVKEVELRLLKWSICPGIECW